MSVLAQFQSFQINKCIILKGFGANMSSVPPPECKNKETLRQVLFYLFCGVGYAPLASVLTKVNKKQNLHTELDTLIFTRLDTYFKAHALKASSHTS